MGNPSNPAGEMGPAGAAGGPTDASGNPVGGGRASTNSSGELAINAQGVAGMPGVSLNAAASATSGSVLNSNGKDLRLESGTQLLLRVTSQ